MPVLASWSSLGVSGGRELPGVHGAEGCWHCLPWPPLCQEGSQSISFQFKLLQKKHEESTPRRGTALTEGGDGKELRGSLRRAQHITWSLFRGVTGKITLSSRVAGV